MKSEQLQIRLTADQKASLKRRARAAGQDVSAYVLSRVLPAADLRFEEIVRALDDPTERRHALAALNDLLVELTPLEIQGLPGDALASLPEWVRCHVAAMVDRAAVKAGTKAPPWVAEVEPLPAPRFATPLRGLRLHLLRASPVAFRRRNIFVDSSVGDRG